MKSSQSNFNLRLPSSYFVRSYLNITVPKQRWKFYNPTCLNDDAVELAEAEIHAEDEKRFVIG